MAFPWNLIRSADLASGLIVEDLKLGLDMAMVGKSPLFFPSAAVTSYFPHFREGLQNQRRRWEEGHVKMILVHAPRLILAAAAQANLGLFTLTVDLMVPPLTLLGILLIGMLLVAGSAKLLGISPTAMFVTLASLVGFISAILISWLRCGRDILPAGSVLLISAFVLGKFPLYCTILSRKFTSGWIRTDRRKL
jgi:cellulose synthase/poly-beta-1,6-N-acetylglucosamine synthase-like glycosyltransferase